VLGLPGALVDSMSSLRARDTWPERPCGQARDILALIARGRYGKIGEQAERTLRMPSAKTLPESVNPT